MRKCEMATEALLDDVISTVLPTRFPEIKCMTSVQKRAFYALANRRDVFAILPTGHGKSLIFQLIPDVLFELNARGLPYPKQPIVLVVCPLRSLVDSHIRELTKRGITATSLAGKDVDEEGILRGKYSFVFGSPESLLENEKWRLMLKSEVYQERLFAFVTDEAHVIPKW